MLPIDVFRFWSNYFLLLILLNYMLIAVLFEPWKQIVVIPLMEKSASFQLQIWCKIPAFICTLPVNFGFFVICKY